jgi:hypothetical protein
MTTWTASSNLPVFNGDAGFELLGRSSDGIWKNYSVSRPISIKTSSFTLSNSDFSKCLILNGTADIIVSIPGVSMGFPISIGQEFDFINRSSFKVYFQPIGAFVSVFNREIPITNNLTPLEETPKIITINGAATLKCISNFPSTDYIILGDV